MVAEVVLLFEVDGADFSGGQFVALVIADVQDAGDGLAHGAGKPEPLLWPDMRGSVGFRAGVVLVDDRAPPIEHLPLYRHRAGGRRVYCNLVARQVVAGLLLWRKPQQTDEHGRHPLAAIDSVALDGRQGGGGIELRHDDDRATERLGGDGEHCRGGVIDRCRREEHRLLVESPQLGMGGVVVIVIGDLRAAQGVLDPFWLARGARAVEHERSERLVPQWLGGVVAPGFLQIFEIGHVVEGEQHLASRGAGRDILGHRQASGTH